MGVNCDGIVFIGFSIFIRFGNMYYGCGLIIEFNFMNYIILFKVIVFIFNCLLECIRYSFGFEEFW